VRLGYTKIHRKIGVAGFVLAALMLVMGIAVAIEGVRLNSPTMSVAGLQPKSFLLIPLTDMLLFASFIGLSLANLKRPEWHKRLIVLATAALLPAATGRLLFALQLPESILLFTVSQEVILIAAIANDLFTRRKIHPAYLWGGALMLIVHLTRFPLAGTSWWSSAAEWIVG
jgi:Ca2+/H+ antiporter